MTNQQRRALAVLAEASDGETLGTRRIAYLVGPKFGGSLDYYDWMHSILARLEKRGLVERVPADKTVHSTAQWRLTPAGRSWST